MAGHNEQAIRSVAGLRADVETGNNNNKSPFIPGLDVQEYV